jgi:glycosyltransferase involved in cell wall biosynthesis
LLNENGYDVLNLEVLDSARHWANRRELFSTENIVSAFAATEVKPNQLPPFLRRLTERMDTSTGAFLANRVLRYLNAVDHDALRELDVDLVIANDLVGVVLAQFLWGEKSIDVVYDAQEIFTDSYDLLDGESLSVLERNLWINIETHLCQCSRGVVTVSPGIAELYRRRHQIDATVIPNFVPKIRHIDPVEKSGPVKFVFVGRAEPHRGLEQLIREWDYSAHVATLELIIPDGQYKSHLIDMTNSRKRQLDGPKFREPIEPWEIVETLSNFDVGVLPYNYPYPYSEASPNKFGEYIAAGLAILSSNQGFVSEVVTNKSLGRVFSWQDRSSFGIATESLFDRTTLQACIDAVVVARGEELNFDTGFHSLLGVVGDQRAIALPNAIWLDALNPSVVEKGRLIPSLLRYCRRALQRRAIRHLRQLGPIINIFGGTRIGQYLAK